MTVTLNSILSGHRWEMSDDELQCLIDTQAELMRLRRIEAAVLGGQQRSHAVSYYRQIAELMEELPGLAGDLNAIADALEAE